MIAKTGDIDVAEVMCKPAEITITWSNSSYSVYSSLWLRDNDPANRDARTGQRLVSVADLPAEPRLRSADPRPAGHLTLSWEDGVTSVIPLSWLQTFDRSLRIGSRPTRMPWMGQAAEAFARCDYQDWVENPAVREDWLYCVGRDGLAFLRGVPAEDGAVLRVAGLIGFVRETSDGSVVDVRSVAEPNNLGCTSRALPVQTDHPYRDPVPGFQMLHCLSAAGQGGESLFVDGLAAAERIRAHDPDAFSNLSQIPILYRFQDAGVDLASERTMLEVDTLGQFRAIHYDDHSIAPLPFKGSRLKKYYAAYRELAELLRDPARAVVYRLQPGDLVLLDNSRILHGRTAFSAGGHHLQKCYLDPDGLYSSLAVLSRTRSSQHD
jgi:alpha-ketoglutarate-dependent taurine dioxygenase